MSEKTTPIEVGSVVRLKSGGDWMTVEAMSEASADCVWFDNKHQLQRNTFAKALLNNKADWRPIGVI